MNYLKVKRFIDIVLSSIALIFLTPIFLLIIIAIKLDSKGPALFKQRRVGIHKTHFYIYKFRTMRTNTPSDRPTHLLDNPDQWITNVGRLLRKTSLDELPQLLNILKGEMSFIGPRPALWNQYDLIAERDKYGANNIPVGLTGWAQIHGRDELPLEDKAWFDGDYARNHSFKLDCICFYKTIINVLKMKGIIEGNNVMTKRRKYVGSDISSKKD